MSQMNISNTLFNDTSTGELAYVEQLTDRLLKNYISTLSSTDKSRIAAKGTELGFTINDTTNEFQDKLNKFFLNHWVEYQRFLLDEGLDPDTIDSWKEIQDFLEGLPDDETMWLKNQLQRLDNRITAMDIPDGGAYDVSADHVDGGGNYATYADLSTALAAISTDDRKSGMSIRFINSTTNKYEQWRYMLEYANTTAGNTAFTTVSNWQGIDSVPTAGSNNLVTSDAVYNLQRQIYNIVGGTVVIDPSKIEPARGIIDGNGNWASGTGYHVVIEVMPKTSYTIVGGNHTANSLAGFLVSYNPTPGRQSYMQKRTNILPNTSYTITSESNSRYLYLLVKIDPSSDRTPASVSYPVTGEIENIQEQIGTLEENVEEVEEKVSENINIEFEQGSLIDATGTETPSNNYIRSGFINIDSIYYIKANSDAYIKLFKYDKNKTPIVSGGQAYSAIGDASEGCYFDINESAYYYRLAIRKTDSSVVTPSYNFGIEIRNAKKYLSMLYHRDYDRDIVNIIEEQRPVISMCLQTSVGEGTYKTDFKLIDVTDLHANFASLIDAVAIKNISQVDGSIIICTGDNVHDTAKMDGSIDPAFTEYMGIAQSAGVYHCCGQHEVGFPNGGDNGRRKDRTFSTQEVFDNYISPMKTAWGLPNLDTVYYYKDFVSSKIRLISLYQYDQPMITDPQDSSLWKYPRNIVWYSQEQLNWLVSTLASTPQGYGIVILMHQPDNTIVRAKETPFFDATRQSISGGDYYIDGCPVRDIVDAFINKTTLTRTYTMTRSEYPASDFTASVNADFTSAVGFFCNFFTGDSHIDTIGKHQDSNQLVLGITSSGQSYDNAIFSKNGRYNQTTKGKGLNINSTLMTIVGYDLTRKELRVGRLGQQYAMTGQKRETDVFKFDVSHY